VDLLESRPPDLAGPMTTTRVTADTRVSTQATPPHPGTQAAVSEQGWHFDGLGRVGPDQHRVAIYTVGKNRASSARKSRSEDYGQFEPWRLLLFSPDTKRVFSVKGGGTALAGLSIRDNAQVRRQE
jgi:hypothetical protein